MHQAGTVKAFGRGATPDVRRAYEFFAVVEQGGAGAAGAAGGSFAVFVGGFCLVFGSDRDRFFVVLVFERGFVTRFFVFLGDGFFRLSGFGSVVFFVSGLAAFFSAAGFVFSAFLAGALLVCVALAARAEALLTGAA